MKKVLFALIASVLFAGSSCTKITVISCPTGEHEEECIHEPQTDTVYVLMGNSGNGGAPGGTDPGSGGGPQPVDP
jgi:hypothetical protein